MKLDILSAGAAQGLAGAVAKQAGVELAGTFGAVGGILERYLAGEACDVVILTHAQVAQLTARNRVALDFCSDLGVVRTSIAVRKGDAKPDVSTPSALRAALLSADAIFLPDPHKATAGIHFARVLATLGIAGEVAARLRPHANGMTAMRALSEAGGHPIGCTQTTEIVATPGVALVAPLPKEHELATVYTVALKSGPASAAARDFAQLLTGPATAAARAAAGFEGAAIRRATAADATAARELVFGVLAEYGLTPDPNDTDADLMDLDAHYLSRGGSFDVAIAPDGRLVACCGLRPMAGGAVELRKMYARREARGQGIGRRLLDRALAVARASGSPRVELETASVLKEAIALYRKAGFVPRPGKPDTRRCDLAFTLDLS
ncbi:MAG TPA: GNAT family N-acetyltransferase [Usitatibacteraceae bacterium]|nr:GNAT family N-acetyltransferase [Usitatibacteraceae bacterium]